MPPIQEDFFFLNAGGDVFSHEFRVDDEAVKDSYRNICSHSHTRELQVPSLETRELEFFLIRTTTGEMVSCSKVMQSDMDAAKCVHYV
jgi:hypothetical protein